MKKIKAVNIEIYSFHCITYWETKVWILKEKPKLFQKKASTSEACLQNELSRVNQGQRYIIFLK